MSTFMQNITGGLSQAGQVLSRSGKKAAVGVQTAAEVAKLNWKLDEAKKEKEAAFAALGKAYYAAHGGENGTEFESDIVAIRRAQLEIDRISREIADCHAQKGEEREYTTVDTSSAKEESSEEKTAEEVAAQAAESAEAAEAVEAAEKDEESGSDL